MKTRRVVRTPQFSLFLPLHPPPLPHFPPSHMKTIMLHTENANIDPFLKDLHPATKPGITSLTSLR
jgi:hypothetical protein